jgi:hypothetical protein
MENLPGDYVAGFVDGEGCFALKFRRDVRHERKNKPVYFSWDIEFAIVLRSDDKELLDKIKNTLGFGRISIDKHGSARYAVNDINNLSKIADFFEIHKLYGKKRLDFELWKEALEIFKRNQRLTLNRQKGERGFYKITWNENDLKRLKEIHSIKAGGIMNGSGYNYSS